MAKKKGSDGIVVDGTATSSNTANDQAGGSPTKGNGGGKNPNISTITVSPVPSIALGARVVAVSSLTIGATGQQATRDIAPSVTWSGGGWTCSIGAGGQRMVSYGGQTYSVFRLNPAIEGDGSRVVYTQNAAEDGSAPHAIGVLPADAPADPWAVIPDVPGKSADVHQPALKANFILGAAPGSMSGAGVQAPDEQVAGAIKMLRPIQTEGCAALSMTDRTREALFNVAVPLVHWAMNIPETVLAKIIEQELGQPYNPELLYNQLARLGFGIQNEVGDTSETRRKNKAKNASAFRIGKGLRRIWSTFSERAAAGDPASIEFVVKLLLEPGSGGFSGAGSLLLYPSDDDYADGADGESDGNGAGSGQGGAGPEGGAGGGTSGTGEAGGAGDASGNDNPGDGSGDAGRDDPSGAAPKDGKGAGTAKKKARSSTPPDTNRFQALPELRQENLPAAYRIAGTVFAGALRVGDDGKPVLIAAADLSTPIARALLPAKSSATADGGAKFIGGLLIFGHYLIDGPVIALVSDRGKLAKAQLATKSCAGSIMISAVPATDVAVPFSGAGSVFGIDLTREQLSLLSKIKKGEGSLHFSADPTGKSLCEVELAADGSAPVARGVCAYGEVTVIGEVDASFAEVGVTLTAEQSAKLFAGVKNLVKAKKADGQVRFEFTGDKLTNCARETSGDAGWGSNNRNAKAFCVRFADLVAISKAITRFAGKAIPVVKADPRGLLVIEVTTDFGTYSIAVPAVYAGTDTRISGFSRPFTLGLAPEAEGAAQDEAASGDDETSGRAPDGDDEQSSPKV